MVVRVDGVSLADKKELQKDRLYMLACPTNADREQCKADALFLELKLRNQAKIGKVINTVALELGYMGRDVQSQAFILLSACDGLIVAPGYSACELCCFLIEMAENNGMQIVYL